MLHSRHHPEILQPLGHLGYGGNLALFWWFKMIATLHQHEPGKGKFYIATFATPVIVWSSHSWH